jgi:hypothetical protein
MNINELFPSKYLKGDDLGNNRVTVTISHLRIEEMGPERDKNPVLYFVGKQKGMVLGKTNGTTIAGLYGNETDDWRGKSIILYTEMSTNFGKTSRVIRVAPSIPQPKVEPAQTVMSTPQVGLSKVNEAHRNYLKKIVELSTRHDSLFEESSDLSELVGFMRSCEEEEDVLMPTVPSPGKAESMYSFLLRKIDDACEMDEMGEPVLSYLLGRVVTGATPPSLSCKPLLDDLMQNGNSNYKDALIACAFIINEQVERE